MIRRILSMPAMGTRLNKYLSQCGLGSRRKVEELISSGRIRVNGVRTVRLGTVIGPDDAVELDGSPVSERARHRYLLLNKPRGYITSASDERGRPTVMDLVPEKFRRAGVYPVGRLDRDTAGLLLLTNDGDLAYRLTRPAFHVPKEYLVDIDRPLDDADRSSIAKGLYIPQLGLKTRPAVVECVDEIRRRVRVVITEGKNRQIRHSFMNLGYRIRSLERTAYGTLTIKRLKRGATRPLTDREMKALKKIAGLSG
ncbi:MAG: rRNA pseudouridine synthase [Spirochaetes bacterium]|nr:rRNA pseudouridine synthase [Spirochaetota bacterium]